MDERIAKRQRRAQHYERRLGELRVGLKIHSFVKELVFVTLGVAVDGDYLADFCCV